MPTTSGLGRGAVALEGDRLSHAPAAALERVVGPVGAGDAFAAGLVAGLLHGYSIEDALPLAHGCGAQAMTAVGDMEALPLWEDVAGSGSATDIRR